MEFSVFDGSTEIGSKGEASVHEAEVAIRLGKLINAYMYILNPMYCKFLTICISHPYSKCDACNMHVPGPGFYMHV